MRIFATVLAIALILLQGRLWFSDKGLREVSGLQASVETQRAANLEQAERNRQLSAEVANLKTGLTALEERARSELGMVSASETFYQVVTSQYAGSRSTRHARHRPRAMSVRAARRLWAIVPAAGRGERFASAASQSIPKQYTLLRGKSVLEWSLRALLTEPRIHGIVVVLAAGDERWSEVARNLDSPKLLTTIGGAHRQDSVMNGLAYLAPSAQADDWVLVHDAARPCLRAGDVRALVDAWKKFRRAQPPRSAARFGGSDRRYGKTRSLRTGSRPSIAPACGAR